MSPEELRKAIRAMVVDMLPVVTNWADVVSVDEENLTMTVKDADDGLEIEDVLLNVDGDMGGITVLPKTGSRVLIGSIEGRNTEAFLLMASEVDKVILNGDQHGGIVISQKVADEVNALKQDLNALKTAFSTWVTVPSDGGAALKAITATWYAQQLTPTQKQVLENEKVVHG
jgi:hypothetical protein